MTKIIGIVSDFVENDNTILKVPFYRIRKTYLNYLEQCMDNKTIIVLLPYIEKKINEYSQLCDGIMVIGGDDIPPKMYKEKTLFKSVNENKTRYSFEIKFIKEYIKTGKPILGICAGMQSINVALRGTLYQDINKQIKTKINHLQKKNFSKPIHNIFIEKNTILYKIVKCNKTSSNSIHHQAIKTLGNNLIISAKSEDNIIEAIELKKHKFCVGLQWHPELILSKKDIDICRYFCKSI